MKFVIILALALVSFNHEAKALFAPLTPSKVSTGQWEVEYAGQMAIDGMDVVVTLEKNEKLLRTPSVLANNLSVPLAAKSNTKQSYRLSLIAMNQPEIRVNFDMEFRRNLVNDAVEKVFISTDKSSDFIFNVVGQEGGVMTVSYSRRIADGEVEHGTFELNPIQAVMNF